MDKEDKTDLDFLEQLPQKDGCPYFPGSAIAIEQKLSTGKLSVAYLARHLGLNLPMILRILHPNALNDVRVRKDLMASASRAAKIRNQHIATIYDLGVIHEHPYLLLEYVAGIPMCERMKQRPYTAAEALPLLIPIADGLSAYWRAGLLHRGVSPKRITIAADGRPLLDIVIMPRERLSGLLLEAHSPFMAGFWAPEEVSEEEQDLDPRSDMFSFGATFYYAVTGRTPFGKGNPEE